MQTFREMEILKQKPDDLSSSQSLNTSSSIPPLQALEIYKNSELAQIVEVNDQNGFTLEILKFNVLNINNRVYTRQSFADINLPYVPCNDEFAPASLKFKGPVVYLESVEILEDKVIGKFKLLSDELFKFSKCLVYPAPYGQGRIKQCYNSADEIVDYTLYGCNLELLSIDGIDLNNSSSEVFVLSNANPSAIQYTKGNINA